MDEFLLIYRAVAIMIVASWTVALLRTLGKPPGWLPPRFGTARWLSDWMTRDHYRLICVAGVLAGLGVLAYSFVFLGL